MTLQDLPEKKRQEYQNILDEWKRKVAEIKGHESGDRLCSGKDEYKELENIYVPKLKAIANG